MEEQQEEEEQRRQLFPRPSRRKVTILLAALVLLLSSLLIVMVVSLRRQQMSYLDDGDDEDRDTARVQNTDSRAGDARPTVTSYESVDTDSTRDGEQAQVASEITILTYYYPWYVGNDWSRHDYVGTPVLGLYDTSDPTVAEQHIEWAAPATDVMVISWWGEDSMSADHFHKGFLQAQNLHKTKFCLIYESMGRLLDPEETVIYFDRESVMDQLVADFLFLREEYFGHEQYYRLDDGRPVVVMYVTRIFRDFEKRFLEELQQAIGMDLFIIGDEPFFWANEDPFTAYNGVNINDEQPVFEAYTAYNMFVNDSVIPGESATDYMMREALPVYERWSNATVFYPHVLTSYHDFRGHEPLSGGKEGFLRQLETFACLPKPKRNDTLPNMLFVTSFNEWWEGTTIEPTEEYGNMYLDALVEFRRSYTGCT